MTTNPSSFWCTLFSFQRPNFRLLFRTARFIGLCLRCARNRTLPEPPCIVKHFFCRSVFFFAAVWFRPFRPNLATRESTRTALHCQALSFAVLFFSLRPYASFAFSGGANSNRTGLLCQALISATFVFSPRPFGPVFLPLKRGRLYHHRPRLSRRKKHKYHSYGLLVLKPIEGDKLQVSLQDKYSTDGRRGQAGFDTGGRRFTYYRGGHLLAVRHAGYHILDAGR